MRARAWFVVLLSIPGVAGAAGRVTKVESVTGGSVRFGQILAAHRDVMDADARPRLAVWRAEILNLLHQMNCAILLAEPDVVQTDLFARRRHPPGGPPRRDLLRVDSREAGFIKNLLHTNPSARREAYEVLVLQQDFVRPILEPVYAAVAALIEARVRPIFLEMFLRLNPQWPAAFANRLRDIAAGGSDGDRRYVVDLIRRCDRTKNARVQRAFYLSSQTADADLERVLTSRGRVLFGETVD